MANGSDGLLAALTRYSNSDFYPFHMPGHKRQPLEFPNPWSIDITEIEGFDNLHHAEGILQELQLRMARLFGSQQSFCLINGSTCGLLSAVSACVSPGGTLLLSRNCHKAVYHSLCINGLKPVYLLPEQTEFGVLGSLSPDTVADALSQNPDIQAVLVVSPTYDGVVSDIASIASIVHSYGIPLIVDEAHGAHFPLSNDFPASALSLGADLVIQSLHKTLPSFTQTAVLHANSSRVDLDKLKWYLTVYQSSSPSYLLMASVDQCLDFLETRGAAQFRQLRSQLDAFYHRMASLKHLKVWTKEQALAQGCFDFDDSKILIRQCDSYAPICSGDSSTRQGTSSNQAPWSGQAIYDRLLTDYHLQLEMASGHYTLALCSLMDTPEGFQRLAMALESLDSQMDLTLESLDSQMDLTLESLDSQMDQVSEVPDPADSTQTSPQGTPLPLAAQKLYGLPELALLPAQALANPGISLPLQETVGKISREFLTLYPPGIPLLAPGERISSLLVEQIPQLLAMDLSLQGLKDRTIQRINVVKS